MMAKTQGARKASSRISVLCKVGIPGKVKCPATHTRHRQMTAMPANAAFRARLLPNIARATGQMR